MNTDGEIDHAEHEEHCNVQLSGALSTSAENNGETAAQGILSPTKSSFQTLQLSSIQDDLEFVYDFILTRCSWDLQQILKDVRHPQSGSKNVLRGRMVLYVYTELSENVFHAL
ncbi:unnamed protein product [Agarophyton chilense]